MTEADIRRIIRQEIRLQQIISSGSAGNTTTTTEDIQSLFPGLPTLIARPTMFPYGFVSRAKKDTISVTAQQGDHPGNKMTLGHRDANPPAVEEGESAVYSVSGYTVKLGKTSISIGKGTKFETTVLGDSLVTFLKALLDAIVAHTHLGNLGAPTGTPINAADFNNLKANNLANNKILAKDGGGF